MNRENKRKILKKGYYKNHACSDAFTCKVCGRSAPRITRGAATATTARTALQVCMSTSSPATGRRTAAGSWSWSPSGCAGAASEPSSTGAAAAAPSAPTERRRTTIP